VGFDRNSKAFLRFQSKRVVEAGKKAVFTNYYRDERIPNSRAEHCRAYITSNYPTNLWDGLDYYTTNNIRNTRKAGFVDESNNPNRLGPPGALPARRADCEYARVLSLSQRPFYDALISGCQFLVAHPDGKGGRKADPGDFHLLPGSVPSAVKNRDKNYQNNKDYENYYNWIKSLAGQPLAAISQDLNQLFAAYQGYVLASEDSDVTGVFPYEPAWITPWEKAVQYGLDVMNVKSWCLALGVDNFPKAGQPGTVVALMKYTIPPPYVIYRPTALEAGCYALHYPTQADNGADSGRTMDCGITAGSSPLKEWIHLQCPLGRANLVSLQLLDKPFPDTAASLPSWRQRHFQKLVAESPTAAIPSPHFI
jgi:hypothetical protein